MSVQAISWVLEHSPAKGTDRLVLIAIANHAGPITHMGTYEAWPGVETIAREAGLDRPRTAQDALSRLVAAGALVRVINGAPDYRCRADRRPNLYRIITREPLAPAGDPDAADGVTDGGTPKSGGDPVDNSPRDDGSRHPDGMTDHDTPQGERGDAGASNGVTDGDTQTVIEPDTSLTSSVTSPGTGAPEDDDDQDQQQPDTRVDAALALLAESDLADLRRDKPSHRIFDVNAWLASAIERRRQADGQRLAELAEAHPDADATALVTLLDPPAEADDPIDLDSKRRHRQAEAESARQREEARADWERIQSEGLNPDPAAAAREALSKLNPWSAAKSGRGSGVG